MRRASRPARLQPGPIPVTAASALVLAFCAFSAPKKGDTYPRHMSPSVSARPAVADNGDTSQGHRPPSGRPGESAPFAGSGGPQGEPPRRSNRSLMLATTTSVDATGLLDVLADAFKAETGIALKWIAVGTGAALKQARDGNADVVIAHARALESEFIRDGYGVNRRVFARNFFMVVGPPDDPAGVAGASSAAEAFGRIKTSGAPFVSRGDRSGTHARELEIWAQAGGPPPAPAYIETGQGMAETLRVAAERRAYTLTDTATFGALASLSGLRPVFENAPGLENIYAVMAVDPVRVPTARYDEAMAFIAFLTSPRGQKLVGGFRGRSGRTLFEPLAGTPGVDLVK
ncbi:MAG TPA: substrate-binding domain-containing protein [Candidatus Aminicenantes bacterium]|nr:substrate-binding domain-containing protein [Candidatus Aminicenantes bacterium]